MTLAATLTYAVAVLFWIVTGLYGLLASQPFVVEQFLEPGLFAPLTTFAGTWWLIALLTLTVWLAPRLSLLRDVELASTTTVVVWLVILGAVTVGGGLDSIAGGQAGWLSLAAAGVLWLIAASEQPAIRGALPPEREATSADFWACVLATLCAVLLEMAVLVVRGEANGTAGMTLLIALRTQLLAGMMAFLVLTTVRGVAAAQSRPVVAEARFVIAALGLFFGWFLDRVLMQALSIEGVTAAAAAYASGYVLAVSLTAPALVRLAEKADGIRSVAGAFAPRFATHTLGFAGWVIVVGTIAVGFDAASRTSDWNFVLARLGVVVMWLCLLGGSIRLVRVAGGSTVFVVIALVVLMAHVAVERFAVPVAAAAPMTPASRWAVDLLRPPAEGPSELFAMLPAHTNITGAGNGQPVEVSWAPLSGGPSAVRPNIFVFVVDSLRRDYLGPYNHLVTFTPAISAFARDSVVFDRAFTQYGATGLSIPSIWTGGSVLHKQYVTPYAPMNALSKLLMHEQYEQWLSNDNIVDVIVPPGGVMQPLDQRTPVKDFRFCPTLEEIRTRLSTRAAGGPPLFVYTLPQDIHVSVITREGSRSVDDAAYEGFSAPVASRVRRFDGCFGAFIDDLRRLGLYDESVIVLTSDHGDSLGEEGRVGHAYTLYPEITRVPLIVHVPASMRGRWLFDAARAAYTTDITPTLYQLLGHDPVSPGSFYGESLARDASRPAGAPRDRMIASSYGSVYGAILRGGTMLYVADAIERREFAFAIGGGSAPGQRVDVDPALRREGMDVITTDVQAIARAYQFVPR